MKWKRKTALLGLAMLGFGLSLVCLFPGRTDATAGVNQQMSFEGKLVNTDGTNIADGTYNVEFKIYQDGNSSGSGSTLLWTEDYLVAGSSGMPSTGGVTLTNGTFQVNLGSVCGGFAAASCGAKTNAGVDFNQQTLWLSIQVGNTSSCTVTSSTTSFHTACGGDNEMTPFIRLTATPQALNSDMLDGLSSSAFGQLANSQAWAGTNTFQPATNITGEVIKQTSVVSPTADIFNVQTENGTQVIQVTGPSADNAAVLIKSIGTGALTLQSGTGTISLGTSTNVNSTNGLTVTGGSTLTLNSTTSSAVTIDSGTTGSILIGGGTSGNPAKTISIGPTATNTSTTIYNLGVNTAGTQTLNIGSAGSGDAAAGTTVNVQGGTTANTAVKIGTNGAGGITIDSGTTGNINIGTGTGSAKTIQIGPNATNTNTTTYQLGTNAAGIQAIAIGSTGSGVTANSSTTVSIQGGTGTNAISIGTTAAVNQVTVGSTNGASNTTIQGGTANINFLTNSASAGVVSKTSTNSTTAFEIQGSSGSTAVLFQADTSGNNLTLNGSNAPQLSAFTGTTSMNNARAEQASVISNGYIYSFGSINGATASTSVEFAKLNANGTTGTWLASPASLPSLPAAIAATSAVAANGYVYVLGGDPGGATNQSGVVYYAHINNDGSLAAWQTSSNDFSANPRANACAVTLSGYVYVLGGYSGNQATINPTVLYAKLNPDGSTGTWNTTTAFTNKVEGEGCTTANGRIYIVGGFGTSQRTDIQYATPSPTAGTIPSWTTNGTSFTDGGEGSQAVVLNGYLYRFGGTNGTTPNDSAEYGVIGSTGAITGILPDTNGLGTSGANRRYFGQALTANGYIYYVGGEAAQGSSSQLTTLYATSPRTSIAGSLDLVGVTDTGALGDSGASGGSLTAGNTNIVGTLAVGGAATINQGLGVGGTLTVAGAALIGGPGSTNATNAFQVQNSSGGGILTADSTGANQNNLITNPSIESPANIGVAGGWQKRGGSETTFAQTLTQQFNGLASLKVTTTAAAGDGAKQNVSLTNGTTYTLSFEAELDPASNAFATMQVGYAYNGSDITTLVSPSYTVISNGWTRYSYTFTQNQTNSGTPYIFIKQTDATVHTFYIDAVTLQTDANADGNYREGKINVGGVVSSPLILQNSANSTTAFQVQDAGGASILTVDTTDTNLLPNPGAEVNDTGWSAKGSGTIIRDTSQADYGTAAFKITGAFSGDGAQYAAMSLPVGQYSIGVSIKNSGSAFGSGKLEVGITNATVGDNTCTLAPAVGASTPVTTGWTRYTCSVTIGTTVGTAFYIKQTEAVSHTYWVDGIELDSGASVTPYAIGNIAFNGVIKTPLTLQNQSNSTTALVVQNSSNNAVFGIDTINNQATLGASNTVNGQIAFNNSSNANAVTLVSGVTTGSYSLTLPTAAPTTSLCLQSGPSTASQLTFGSCGGAGSGVTSVGTFDGGTPNATGATITAGVIFLQSASASNPGAVNTGTQTFAGAKTFTGQLQVGSATTDTTQVLLQLDSFSTFADTASCSTTTNQGSIYYNTNSNSIRGCINGAWEDMDSTDGLGLQLFGVVPDTGSNPGDIAGVTGTANGPCKVSVGADTGHVAWTACTAYSGGRKVIVTSGNAATANAAGAGSFQHLCLTGANNQPALSTAGTEVANLSTVSFASATSPILCLADIKFAAANATITTVYDTRTFTTTDKQLISDNSAAGLSYMAIYSATRGVVATPAATANLNAIAGVVVASTGAASSSTVNAIIAIGGPTWVKASAGTVAQYIFTGGTTAGYAATVATKPAEGTGTIYNLLGESQITWSGATTCAANLDSCQGSLLTTIDKR